MSFRRFLSSGKDYTKDWLVREKVLITMVKGELMFLAAFRGNKTCFFPLSSVIKLVCEESSDPALGRVLGCISYHIRDLGLVTTPSHIMTSAHSLLPRVNQQRLSQACVSVVPTKSLIPSLLFYSKPPRSFIPEVPEEGHLTISSLEGRTVAAIATNHHHSWL